MISCSGWLLIAGVGHKMKCAILQIVSRITAHPAKMTQVRSLLSNKGGGIEVGFQMGPVSCCVLRSILSKGAIISFSAISPILPGLTDSEVHVSQLRLDQMSVGRGESCSIIGKVSCPCHERTDAPEFGANRRRQAGKLGIV